MDGAPSSLSKWHEGIPPLQNQGWPLTGKEVLGDTLTVTSTQSAFATTVKWAPDTHSSWKVQAKRQPVTISSSISGQYTHVPALGVFFLLEHSKPAPASALVLLLSPLQPAFSSSRQPDGFLSMDRLCVPLPCCSLVPIRSVFSLCLSPGLSVRDKL